ncbi:MAG: FAD-dependent oxidoreductase [Glaciihabitans sp.]|nr:FAD-dependent oxidoreductase [Glaciihabitans sp.]
MTNSNTFVIVGAALAGVSAAEELRKQGFDGRIVMFGREARHPYIRPPLSKDFLAGKEEADKAFVHPESWYEENSIELELGTEVTSINRNEHTVTVRGEQVDAEPISYTKLLIATGSTPRQLQVPGATIPGVHYLRSLTDATALRAELRDGGKAVAIIGSGWIGMEVAATARELGNDVRVILNSEIPLTKAIGGELGQFFADVQAEHGVIFDRSTTVEEIVPTDDGVVGGVRVGERSVLAADLVVVAIGAAPTVELAVASGLEVDNGILVDASLRTSDPDIFAAGDVANAFHPTIGARIRSEHWANALNQGPAAARTMLGQDVSYDEIPYAYSDQFEIGMEFSGYLPLIGDATLAYRGDPAKREFIAFWMLGGRVVAGMNVNVWDVNEDVQGIIRRGNIVDVAALADPDVPLKSL